MRTLLTMAFLALALIAVPHTAAVADDGLDRTNLPIQAPVRPPVTELDARKAKAPAPFKIDAPKGAPNVVIVLIDDIGFGTANCFGGPIATPTLDKLSKGGLRYNQFHTTALCSPTRMAMLTGRNHHSANAGSRSWRWRRPSLGNQGRRPKSVEPVAEMLRLNGYSTAAFGKYHETAPWEVSISGPFDRWPTRSGFDKFYGFIGGETNQWAPVPARRHDARRAAGRPRLPRHHRPRDAGDQLDAIPEGADAGQAVLRVLGDRRDARTAPGPAEVDRRMYKGKFDMGWDKYREA